MVIVGIPAQYAGYPPPPMFGGPGEYELRVKFAISNVKLT